MINPLSQGSCDLTFCAFRCLMGWRFLGGKLRDAEARMWFGTALLSALWFFLVPATLLAQSPGCRDPYTDNSIGGEQRAKLLLENGAACVREETVTIYCFFLVN